MAATSDVVTQAARLRRIDELSDAIRARARDLDERAVFPAETFDELRDAGLLSLTAPVEFGGAGLWSEGRYRPYYELLEALARVDSVTAQLLQVHSHALGIVSGLAERRPAPPPAARDRLRRQAAGVGRAARPSRRASSPTSLAPSSRSDPAAAFASPARSTSRRSSPAADELLIWTAVPGAGPYAERSTIALVPADAPEVEVIDQWDVMGMRATVSHSVRITAYDVPPERVIGEPGAWTRRDPRTFTLAFAANHIGAAGAALEFTTDWVRERPNLSSSEITRATLGAMSSDLFAARSARSGRPPTSGIGATTTAAELESIRTLHLGKRVALT